MHGKPVQLQLKFCSDPINRHYYALVCSISTFKIFVETAQRNEKLLSEVKTENGFSSFRKLHMDPSNETADNASL